VNRTAIGVDIGGTNMRAALVTADGTILGQAKARRLDRSGPREVDRIAEFVQQLMRTMHCTPSDIAGIGLGIPGWVDHATQEVRFAPKLMHWQGVPIISHLESVLDLPVYLDSDPHMAIRGEQWMGAGRGLADFIMVTLGTGIGCGLVINGELYAGHRGFAPELGHTVIADTDEVICSCGTPGCLESLTAGPAIGDAGRRAALEGRSPRMVELAGGQIELITARTVVAACREGDVAATRVLQSAARLLGIACANLVCLLEPQRIVVGGGLAEVGEILLEPIRRTMQETCYLIRRGYVHVDLVPAELGDSAGVIGAAKLAFDQAGTSGEASTAPKETMG